MRHIVAVEEEGEGQSRQEQSADNTNNVTDSASKHPSIG